MSLVEPIAWVVANGGITLNAAKGCSRRAMEPLLLEDLTNLGAEIEITILKLRRLIPVRSRRGLFLCPPSAVGSYDIKLAAVALLACEALVPASSGIQPSPSMRVPNLLS